MIKQPLKFRFRLISKVILCLYVREMYEIVTSIWVQTPARCLRNFESGYFGQIYLIQNIHSQNLKTESFKPKAQGSKAPWGAPHCRPHRAVRSYYKWIFRVA